MHKHINNKPIKKVRRVEIVKKANSDNKRTLYGDIDDFIFGDERSVPSNR